MAAMGTLTPMTRPATGKPKSPHRMPQTAYLRRAKETHPDAQEQKSDDVAFKQIGLAYQKVLEHIDRGGSQ